MGEVVVLPPQKDFFIHRSSRSHSFINSTMRSRPNTNASRIPPPSPNSNFNSRSNFGRSRRRRRSPTLTKRVQNTSEEPPVSLPATKNLVVGQVRILKRGEALTDINAPKSISPDNEKGFAYMCKTSNEDVPGGDDLVSLTSTDRLGPEPEMVPVKIQAGDWYAGSGFVSSPPPSSLPLPVFFSKKKNQTSDLRRILGLEI